ncbi:beta-glucosidase [Pedobacter sp. HMF7647]|uniref:Beta-glucosidase n=1 Tax=Hufsiella arboris TaxID=2695275 RepID=A0A7K1YFN1_9SPHI|nr:glycoside hydrolase family 3 N-terminal domain-containing protein [Hufsiella arboris]MXV52908.1 beta-glucosidase [Hufsiella arboris]
MILFKGRYLSLITISCVLLFAFKNEERTSPYPYKNPKLSVDERVKDLLSRMTLKEKILQLDMFWGKEVADSTGHETKEYSAKKTAAILGDTGIGSVHDLYPLTADITNKIQKYALENTRLGIPVLFIEEGLHGYSSKGSTSFPIPLQMSAAWDTALVYKAGRVIATETRAHGVNMILGPVLCLPHDPRWGRVEETFGEDPYLDALNGVAMVKGLQGKRLSDNDAVVAEPKHFSVHGIPEAGSNTAPVNIGEREERSTYLYVFERAVKEGGAKGIMAAYSEIDGIPCVDNKWLLTDVLRKEWGFDGFVLSDLGAIKMSLESHAIASSVSDALAQTFNAGLNMQFYDFDHKLFMTSVEQAIKDKKLSEAQLNKTVGEVLRVKFLLGLFDNPYILNDRVSKVFHSSESQDLALKIAQESICLLKNDDVLPLKANQSIAVLGPLAKSTYLGGYSNTEDKAISVLEGLQQRAGSSAKISFEPGYSMEKDQGDLLQKAVNLAKASDVAIVVLGEDLSIVGEGKDRAHLDLDENQMELVRAVKATAKPVVVVLENGRPLTINWIAKNIPAIVESWFGGEKNGLAIADVLLGNVNPSGKLPMTFPRSLGQVPFYYNHKPTSYHRYVDEQSTPLYAFGHGLSYTKFEYSDLSFDKPKIAADETIEVSLNVKNTGPVAGAEVVQVYVRDVVSSVTTPVMALKGFHKVMLKPGETSVIRFKLGPEHLSLWNKSMKRVVEPGEFKIMVGSASDDIRLNGSFQVIK